MTYATPSALLYRHGARDLLKLIDDRTTDQNDQDAVLAALDGAPAIERALADADADIDAYLAGRYALPLATLPPMLERVACDLARYRLYDQKATEEVRARYEDAVRVLEQIARGAVTLGLPAANAPAPEGVEFTTPPRCFSDSLGGGGF